MFAVTSDRCPSPYGAAIPDLFRWYSQGEGVRRAAPQTSEGRLLETDANPGCTGGPVVITSGCATGVGFCPRIRLGVAFPDGHGRRAGVPGLCRRCCLQSSPSPTGVHHGLFCLLPGVTCAVKRIRDRSARSTHHRPENDPGHGREPLPEHRDHNRAQPVRSGALPAPGGSGTLIRDPLPGISGILIPSRGKSEFRHKLVRDWLARREGHAGLG